MATRPQLQEKIMQKLEVTKKDSKALVDSVIDSITECLQEDGYLQLTGFGTFKVSLSKARQCRNPKTGETVDVDEHNVARFSSGTLLKDAINADKPKKPAEKTAAKKKIVKKRK